MANLPMISVRARLSQKSMITPCYVLCQQYWGLQLKILAFIAAWETQGALKEVLMINECIYMAAAVCRWSIQRWVPK